MALTVGELRAKLAALPDEYEVVIVPISMRVMGTIRTAQRINEASLEWFEEQGARGGLLYYLDGKETPNALCLWA